MNLGQLYDELLKRGKIRPKDFHNVVSILKYRPQFQWRDVTIESLPSFARALTKVCAPQANGYPAVSFSTYNVALSKLCVLVSTGYAEGLVSLPKGWRVTTRSNGVRNLWGPGLEKKDRIELHQIAASHYRRQHASAAEQWDDLLQDGLDLCAQLQHSEYSFVAHTLGHGIAKSSIRKAKQRKQQFTEELECRRKRAAELLPKYRKLHLRLGEIIRVFTEHVEGTPWTAKESKLSEKRYIEPSQDWKDVSSAPLPPSGSAETTSAT